MEKNNPIVLVVGARRGIGKATALKLAKDGFDLVITDIAMSDKLKLVADEIIQIGRSVVIVIGDISDVNRHGECAV